MTNKENTREVIYSIYGRSVNGLTLNKNVLNTIDIDYLVHIIQVTSVNREELYNSIHSKSKPESVAKNLICSIINIDLYCQAYKTVCTYKQVKDILKSEFNYNIDDLVETISNWVIAEREELKND